MIILNVTYKCKPGMREKFVEAIKAEGIDAASRAEAGNFKYDYYMSVDNSDELLLVEKWRDADALAEHGRQPHFARLGQLKPDYVLDTGIEKTFVSQLLGQVSQGALCQGAVVDDRRLTHILQHAINPERRVSSRKRIGGQRQLEQ